MNYLKGNTPLVVWVHKVKYEADGFIGKHKAQLVAKGYSQQEKLDSYESFRWSHMFSVRNPVAIASINTCHLFQLFVNNTFLHGSLNAKYKCICLWDLIVGREESVQIEQSSLWP